MWPVTAFYSFLRAKPPAYVGHNPVAAGAYTLVYGLCFLEVATGLVMRGASSPTSWVQVFGSWAWLFGGLQMARHFWDAAIALDAGAHAQAEALRFPQWTHDGMEALLRHAGLDAVRSVPIEIETSFRDFDDFWSPFLGGTGPAPAYATALPPDRQEALRERLRAALPPGPGGHIVLKARAWAVRGTVV